MELTIETRMSQALKRQFIKDAHFRSIAENEASFVALPKRSKSRQYYVAGGFHPSKSGSYHWHIKWTLLPSSKPPPGTQRRSQEVGGYDGALVSISRLLNRKSAIEMHLDAHYEAASPEANEIFSELLRGVRRVKAGRRTMTEGWTMSFWEPKPKAGTVSNFALLSEGKQLQQVFVLGKVRSKITDLHELFTELEGRIWRDLVAAQQA